MTGALFSRAAPIYRQLGWLGTIPLPTGQKWPPPSGFTGADGVYPDDAMVAYWSNNGESAGNIGLRMPAGAVGIDVDDHDAKTGGTTLVRLEATLGPLPATWRSSARDAPSGILFFRVPLGALFAGALPGNIEIIQPHHRYAVVAPSVHPTGAEYRWFGPDGNPAPAPRIEELPELPAPWVAYLSAPERARPAAPAVPTESDAVFNPPKLVESAQRQWARLRDRFVGFVRRAEMFGWAGDAHGTLLELTRELAQLAPGDAHRAVAEWFGAGGAGYVDDRVWAMLDSALGKYPADKIMAPVAVVDNQASGATTDPRHGIEGPAQVPWRTDGGGQGAPSGSSGRPASTEGSSSGPQRLPMIDDHVWDTYGWTRSIRAQARAADVCPDAVLGAMLATYAARIPPGVRIVTGTKMPLGANLVVSLVGPSGSDKSTAFALAQRISPGSAVPVINNPGSGEAFAASYVHPDPDGEGAVSKRARVLKPDPRALFYVAEGALLGSVGSRLGSTWLPHLRSLAVDESLSTTNATQEINRQVPAMSYSAGVVVGFQVTTASVVLHDTGTGTAQRFLWFTSLSTEDMAPGVGIDAPDVAMATPVLTRLGAGIDEHNQPIHYLAVTASITDRIRAEQRHTRLTRDIAATDDHDAHRHTLVAKLAAIAVLADSRVMIEEADWWWAEQLYAASGAARDTLLELAEERARTEQSAAGSRMAQTDRARRGYDGDEARVADVILRRVDKLGRAKRKDIVHSVASRDRHLLSGALDQLETHGYLRRSVEGEYYRV